MYPYRRISKGQQTVDEIAIGLTATRARVGFDGAVVHVVLEGDTAMGDILAVMEAAQAQGWLSPTSRLLLDLSRYGGSIDWEGVRAIKAMPCWGSLQERRPRAAYIIRDSVWALLIRMMSAIFAATQHRTFTNEAAAREWLLSDDPPGGG